MSDLKPTAEECQIGECFPVKLPSKSEKLTAFRPMPQEKGRFAMEKRVFERTTIKNDAGELVEVWQRVS